MKVIARLLYRLKRSGIPFRLAAWHCGTAENFNPLDGAVTLTADAPQEQVNALLEAEFAVLNKEIADARYAGQMHIETGVRVQKALSAEDSAALLTLLWLMPNNLYHETESEALPFVLASFGTSMSISGLKSEGKAVLTAVLAVACIVGLGVIAGFTFMDLRTAIYGPIEVAGGGQAGLVFLTALREKSGTESPARALDYVLALCRNFGFRTKNANYRYGYAEIGEGRS